MEKKQCLHFAENSENSNGCSSKVVRDISKSALSRLDTIIAQLLAPSVPLHVLRFWPNRAQTDFGTR